jgi:hypothetical protein
MSPDKYVNATRLIGVLESVLEDEEKKEASLEKMAMVSSLRCAIRLLSEEVAADVEPVIHCKDCQKWHRDEEWCEEHSHFIGSEGEACHPWESSDWKTFDENYFCADAVRREGT